MSMEDVDGGRLVCFPPVVDAGCQILILGSMPGVASLTKQQYYGHTHNQFWPMMFDLLAEPPTEDYEAKKAMLLRHRIALWDVVYSCTREGSLDTRIKDPAPNDFKWLFETYPDIRLVYLNGGKAAELYQRLVLKRGIGTDIPYTRLPSTSPAYTLPYEKKRQAWGIIVKH